MSHRPLLSPEVVAAVARGATILTGNTRAARTLRLALRAADPVNPAAPPIFAWDNWTRNLWHHLLLRGGANAMLLNRIQEHALWRAVLADDPDLSAFAAVDSLAEMSAQTWGVVARHRGLRRLPGSAYRRDTLAFERWASAFEQRCRGQQYLPQARLEGVLRRALLEGSVPPTTTELFLVGFDRLQPAQEALLDAFRSSGCTVTEEPPRHLPDRRFLVAADDEASEFEHAAQWARHRLLSHAGPNPPRIAVIVPGLEMLRPAIDRVFRAVLAPESQSIAAPASALPYEFSTGIPLAETPMIAAALDLLEWASAPLPLDHLSDLLLSPYFAAGVERSQRAEFDAFDLRKWPMLRPEIALGTFTARLARSDRRSHLGILHASLQAMQTVVRRSFGPDERRLHSDWAEAIRELLAGARWAAGGDDSTEFQTREKWESALDELATLDFEGGRVPFHQALQTLLRIARETTFAPESRGAPVQVMGPEESAGSSFDAVWFLQASAENWPATAAGTPLIEWALRRELGLPGSANGPADFAQAQRVTTRIAACAEQAVFSYAREAEGSPQRPSAVLDGLDLRPLQAPQETQVVQPLVRIDAVEDLAPIPAFPDRTVTGGASVLQDQAACAFRAFARHRLGSTDLDTRDPGLNASERGISVHRTLEKLWNETVDQNTLRSMTPDTRDDLLMRSIDEAIRGLQAEVVSPWDRAYLETQRQRMFKLGKQWLQLELDRRTPFRVVRHEREDKDVQIGPLHLTLRLDRVDETPDGAVLIDYKTGEARPAAWLTDRPDEPQLPLYAVLAHDLHLHTIAFGKVRPGKEMDLVGYAQSGGTLQRPATMEQPDLQTQIRAWRVVLTRLAVAFADGEAQVLPKTYPTTCRHCAQRVLCRLDVASLQDDLTEEEEFASSVEDRDG